MKAIAGFALLLAALPTLALAQHRTPDWYATHDSERQRVERACQRDPGRNAGNPECQNASTGSWGALARQADRTVKEAGPAYDPDTVEFWAQAPRGIRIWTLKDCALPTPKMSSPAECAAARASLGSAR